MTLPTAQLEAIRNLQDHVGAGNRLRGFREDEERLDYVTNHATRALALSDANDVDTVTFGREFVVDLLETLKLAKVHGHVNRLMLIVGEVVEAHEELRSGRGVNETYYTINGREVRRPTTADGPEVEGADWIAVDGSGDTWTGVSAKPEGVPSEITDVIIRSLDFDDNAEIDGAGSISEKDAHNATRPYKHGRRF